MTTDRELLELAAKAVGIELQWESDGTIQNRMNRPTIPYFCQGLSSAIDWNPLIDDGDALRLAVKLGFDIRPYTKISTVYIWSHAADKWIGEFYGASDDPYAATRRAIVRAAAEIGRAM